MPETMEQMTDRGRFPSQPKSVERIPPRYEKNFGSEEAEKIMAEILLKKGPLVESVEHGTDTEDRLGKVDLWVKFLGIEAPLGLQYTITTNDKELEAHETELKARGYIAKKEYREDATIKYAGNANVILVHSNKNEVRKLWEESQSKGVSPAEIVNNKFVIDIFNQIFNRLGIVNPAQQKILSRVFIEAYRLTKKR